MIYLDVTDTCQSPMNTGVQRVVRGIFRSFHEAGAPVTPLVWEPTLDSFCTLDLREFGYLEQPFAGKTGKTVARPRRGRGVPVLTKLWRRATHRRNRIDLAAKLTAADVFFAPEIFKDSRRDWLNGSGSRIPARRLAVFHDAIAWRHPEWAPVASRKGFVEYVMTLSAFDALIAVSQASAEDLRACWKSQGVRIGKMPPITVIGWPVDELFNAPKSTASSREISEGNTPPKILCVGTLEARKNQLTLLTASEQLWHDGLNFELVLIGRTTATFGRRVLAEVKRLRVAGRSVVWRRHVDDASLLAAYDECAFTVFPSLAEGFGLPIIESLRRGRPCICGANGALGEVADGGCLTVNQTDPVALSGVMRKLLVDVVLYERLSAESRVRQFPSWQDYAEKLLPLLASPDVR